MAWPGLAWPGLAWPWMAWPGLASHLVIPSGGEGRSQGRERRVADSAALCMNLTMGRCRGCAAGCTQIFCAECDQLIHSTLRTCPGCVSQHPQFEHRPTPLWQRRALARPPACALARLRARFVVALPSSVACIARRLAKARVLRHDGATRCVWTMRRPTPRLPLLCPRAQELRLTTAAKEVPAGG